MGWTRRTAAGGVATALAIVGFVTAPSASALAPAATHLSISLSSSWLTYGKRVTVRARLADAGTGAPISGAAVTFSWSETDVRVQSKRTTSLAGVASITLLPVDNTSLSVSYAGSATEAATESKAMIHVRQAVGIRSPAARLGAAYGHKILVWGAVAPGYFTMVQPAPTYYATIQWRDASDWHRQLRVKLQLQKLPNGRVDFGYVARFVPGSRHLRTTVPGVPGDERGISRVLYIPRPR